VYEVAVFPAFFVGSLFLEKRAQTCCSMSACSFSGSSSALGWVYWEP
jgi:hypothetical protein